MKTWRRVGRQAPPLRQCSLSARHCERWRMLTSTCTHYPVANGTASFEVGGRCMTKPMPESSGEMSIVAKAAGVGDLAERLVRSRRRLFLVERRCHRTILQ